MSDADDLKSSLAAISNGAGTYQPKQLAPAVAPAAIPARNGTSAPIVVASGGAVVGFTLKGAKIVSGTDGIFTISYPETMDTLVGSTTVTIPAIAKTP